MCEVIDMLNTLIWLVHSMYTYWNIMLYLTNMYNYYVPKKNNGNIKREVTGIPMDGYSH
jgi:hypothetical protein